MAAKEKRVDEQAALEVIRAVEDVVSHRWLEEGSGPTPDLEVVLGDGRVVRVEITMSTEGDRLPSAMRSTATSFHGGNSTGCGRWSS